jgi:hypothetical protein
MAKVKLNPVIEEIRGKVGDLVFKGYGDETIIARRPDMEGRELTEAQEAHRERFRQATLYGKMVIADPEAKALYDEAAKKRGAPNFALMVADFFNAPTVDEVDLSDYHGEVGDPVVVQAHDDFDVLSVQVDLMDSEGNVLEGGEAQEEPPESGRWIYEAQTAVPTGQTVRIAVTAEDRPGGKGEATEEKTL